MRTRRLAAVLVAAAVYLAPQPQTTAAAMERRRPSADAAADVAARAVLRYSTEKVRPNGTVQNSPADFAICAAKQEWESFQVVVNGRRMQALGGGGRDRRMRQSHSAVLFTVRSFFRDRGSIPAYTTQV